MNLNFKDVAEGYKGEPGIGSPSPYRFDLLSPIALAAVAELRSDAAKVYGDWTYRDSPIDNDLNKALIHIYAYLSGDMTEKGGDPGEHLVHAFCRLMFAVEKDKFAQATTDDEVERCIGTIQTLTKEKLPSTDDEINQWAKKNVKDHKNA